MGLRFRMTPKVCLAYGGSLARDHPSHPWLLRTFCSDGLATACPGLMGSLGEGWTILGEKDII